MRRSRPSPPCGFVRNKSLAQFQAVNDPGTPLVQMRSAGREKIFDRVAQEVERARRLNVHERDARTATAP